MGHKHDGKRRYPGPNRIMGRVCLKGFIYSVNELGWHVLDGILLVLLTLINSRESN